MPNERDLPHWRRLDARNPGELEAARALARRIADLDPRYSIEHERFWFREPDAMRIYACEKDGAAVGLALLVGSRTSLPLRLGEVTIGGIPVERQSLSGCPLFDPSVGPLEAPLTRQLLTRLAKDLPRDGVGFAWGARADTPLYELLVAHSERLPFRVVGYGEIYHRRLIDLPARYEDYLAGLGAKTREDLRRNERRLGEATKNTLRIEVYDSIEKIPAFLDAATVVSQKSYQWQLLRLGLRDRDAQVARFSNAARQGWLRCYVLFGNDTPLAFMVGFLFGGTYSSEDIAYDPDWQKFSVGNVLHCRVIRDLIALGGRAQRFDFMYGDNTNKERLSTTARLEGNFYLFPRTVRGLFTYSIIEAVNRSSELAGRTLQRLGTKSAIRKRLRQWARKRVV